MLTGTLVTGVHIMLALGRPGFAPFWYHVAGAILIILTVLMGVRLSGQSTAMLHRRR